MMSETAEQPPEWFETDLPSWLDRLESCVAGYGGEPRCAVGGKISYADVCLWSLLRECPPDEMEETAKAAAGCATLNAIADAVAANPRVEAWLKERPVTAF